MQYYMVIRGERLGPFDKSQLVSQGLEHDTLVWYQGAPGWVPAREVADLRDLLERVPPPAPRRQEKRWDDDREPAAGRARLPQTWYTPSTFRSLYGWYFGLFIIGIAFLVLTLLFVLLYENQRVWRPGFQWPTRNPLWEVLAIFSMICAVPPLIAHIVLFFVQLYKMWNLIQDGRAQTTPGAAVGLWFVPFFNLYWIFVAFYGLANNLNQFMRRHGLRGRPAPAGLALTTCIILVIPYVNVTASIFLLITMGMLKNTAADIAAALARDDAYGRAELDEDDL